MSSKTKSKTRETASRYKPGDWLIEEILLEGKPHFAVKDLATNDDARIELSKLEFDGTEMITWVPIEDDLLSKGAVVLPGLPQAYGDASLLFLESVDFVLRYASVDSTHARLAVLAVMTGWLQEKAPVLPILNPRGGSETGKSRLGSLLWLISYHGLRADGALSLSSLFRNIERWHGAVFMNEGDLGRGRSDESESRQIVKALNAGYEKPGTIWRTNKETMESEVFSVFGLKIIATRQGFPDDALESRAFVIPMRTSADRKKNLPPEALAHAQTLRDKLLAFRLDNLDSFTNDYDLEFPGVNPRLNQILQPMASLAKSKIPAFYREIATIAQELAEALVEERAKSLDGLIVRAYFLLDLKGPGGTTAREIAETILGNFEEDLKPERIGKRLGPLGFRKTRATTSARSRLVELPPEMREDMARKYLPRDERDTVLVSRESESPMVTPEPNRSSAETVAAPALFPDPATIRDEDKLFGGKNFADVFSHIRNRVRWDSARPDLWIARDAMLAFQMPENAQGAALALVQIVRRMETDP